MGPPGAPQSTELTFGTHPWVGLPLVTAHRASLMVGAGVSPKVEAERLGHATPIGDTVGDFPPWGSKFLSRQVGKARLAVG
jgi:hypothetical protein